MIPRDKSKPPARQARARMGEDVRLSYGNQKKEEETEKNDYGQAAAGARDLARDLG